MIPRYTRDLKNFTKAVFCEVRVRSVGYEICYRTNRTIGTGYGSLTELTELSGNGMEVLQNSQTYRVRVWKSYRTHNTRINTRVYKKAYLT